LVFLDTNPVIRLIAFGGRGNLSSKVRALLESEDLYISPLVKLELYYLYEIKRFKENPEEVIKYLSKTIGLKFSGISFLDIIEEAARISWTRDPFDRLIVAEAKINGAQLVTADKNILENYKHAVW